MITYDEAREHLIPLYVQAQEIEKHCWMRPTAYTWPPEFHPEIVLDADSTFVGVPVIRGDRFGLLYTPPVSRNTGRAEGVSGP